MDRIAGVTGAQARERLLRAAADVSPSALAMGSALVPPDLHAVGDQEWAALLARVVNRPFPSRHLSTDRNSAVKVQISSERCQGHGRCYDLAPDLFGDDDEGYGKVLGTGVVPPGKEREAHLAAANCPERAIDVLREA